MKREKLIRHLRKHGCVPHRQGSRHELYRNPVLPSGRPVPLPRHREILEPVARAICKQLGVPPP